VGLRTALELVFLNPRLTAREAREMRLVNAVYPTESLDSEVMALAEKLAKGPTKAYAVAKSLIHQAAGVDRLDHHLDRELESLARIADGREFDEGIRAFFAKRTPDFEGR
jgi:2-(1,2-epoxy-1,2-dihydrophenyl)acetyl-CoA isomerase